MGAPVGESSWWTPMPFMWPFPFIRVGALLEGAGTREEEDELELDELVPVTAVAIACGGDACGCVTGAGCDETVWLDDCDELDD